MANVLNCQIHILEQFGLLRRT